MEKLEFNYYDSLLLLASSQCQRKADNVDYLRDIIAFVDYIDHSIITYQEFSSGLAKLMMVGMLKEDSGEIVTSLEFDKWFEKQMENKKRPNMQKTVRMIMEYLNLNFTMAEFERLSESYFTEVLFNEALDKYLGKN
jgi:hypothetical protein